MGGLELTAASAAELGEQWRLGSQEAENVLLTRACVGDIEAQRVMAEAAVGAAVTEPGGAEDYLGVANALCRLAAAHGYPLDRRRLAGLLSLEAAHSRQQGYEDTALGFETECLVLLNELANEGFEEAAQAVNDFADYFTAEAVAAAARAVVHQKPAHPAPEAPEPPPLQTSLPPSTRWEAVKLWLEERCWAVRFYFENVWFALRDLGRALIGRI